MNAYIHPLQIGSVELDNNLILAPMAGFTNLAFRLIAKDVGGCGLVSSEMVAALGPDGRGSERRFAAQTRNLPEEHPLLMQVYGRDPERCAACAGHLVAAGADIVDLNCGCPVRKAKDAGCGVALMREPEQVGRIIAAMSAAVAAPITIKMRLGFDNETRNAIEVAQAAIAAGAQAITVHARTGEDKHGSPVDFSALAQVADSVAVPVIANGSLNDATAIRRAKDAGHADGYMIGRAACGDPWLFRNIISELSGQAPHQPSPAERRALLERHFNLILDLFGEQHGCLVMRKYTFFYCQGLPGVRRFRDQFMRITSRKDFHTLVEHFFSRLAP